jgi:hypothetical protein
MVRAHWSLPDGGPKTYRRRETLTTIVDSHDYSLLQLVDFIGESFYGVRNNIFLCGGHWRMILLRLQVMNSYQSGLSSTKRMSKSTLLVKSMTLMVHCSSHQPNAGFTLLFRTYQLLLRVLHLLIWILS